MPTEPYTPDPASVANANTVGAANNARSQQNLSTQTSQYNNGDWRVKISLAPQSDYLYNAVGPPPNANAGILEPLRATDGVIFPYTPQIQTAYKATYTPKVLTHSNYTGQFYQGSTVDPLTITGIFTAQDTAEANYLLAVIHFFRSVTKMFYGQDAERGSPPPLVYLTGLGQNQFMEHTGVIGNFDYTLPADVDYIRAKVSPNTVDFSTQRPRQSSTTTNVSPSKQRLSTAGLTSGGLPPSYFATQSPNLGASIPTYVPTKMTITISLIPIQTRHQLSQQFSLKGFATGDLLRGGFW